ncbi:MAG: mobile mystery protein B [Campylobacterales bacterium]
MIRFDKPGETPLDDISGLIAKGVRTRADLDNAESENILLPTLKYVADSANSRRVTIDVAFLKKLHKEMLGNVWLWAGEFRTVQTSIGVEPHKIYHDLLHLLDDLRFWEKNWDYKDTATRLHHKLVKIHPFANGNGRWSRLATDIWLIKNGHDLIEWGGNLISANTHRKNYIDALKAADNGHYEPLKEFMFRD